MIKIKSREEIDGIKKSCVILSRLIAHILPFVKIGVETKVFDIEAKKFLEQTPARSWFYGYENFPSQLCVSVNEEVIHGIPGKRKLKEGDIVSLDCGVEINGYYSDAALTVGVGKISKKAADLLRVTKECLYLGINAAGPEKKVSDISKAVFDHANSFGYGVVRQYCGHGVGLEPHEDPQIPNYISLSPNPKLRPGMVLAIEPMINLGGPEVKVLKDNWTVSTLDNSISAHFEHTIAITETGVEVLSSWGDL